jgi:serine/threonine protein kinase
VDRGVVLAVERALELPESERGAFLASSPDLDIASRAQAARLLAACEAVEQEEADRAVDARRERGVGQPSTAQGAFGLNLGELLVSAAPEATKAPTERRLASDAMIGPFRITRFVAAGGMGEVYEAVDTRVGRRVALKTLPLFSGRDRSERFAREAVLMARLEHPSIARLYEWGTVSSEHSGESGNQTRTRATPYIAMEFVDGEPLRDALTKLRTTRASPTQLVEFLLPVVDAVAHAHARGVLHRDIKPSNIIVDSRGAPRLLDFGVAALIDDGGNEAITLTEAAAPGTLTYMSPEQVRGGARRVTTQSDVYALGLLLHEAIRGVPVVDPAGRGIVELIEEVLQRQVPRLHPGVSGVSADLDFVVRRALAKDPRDRYGSADALAEDLRRVCRGESPLGREIGTLELLKRVVWRRRKMIAPAFAALVVLAVVAALGAAQYVRAREAEARSDVLIGQLLEGSKPLVQDLHQRLLAEDQPLAARKAALEATAAYLEWVQANSGDDERVLVEVADSYRRLAEVSGSAGKGSLGETALASDYFERSRAILDRLIERGTDGSSPISVGLRLQLLLARSGVLLDIGSLRPYAEQAGYFAIASADKRAAVDLIPPGATRDRAEVDFLFTEVKRALWASDIAALEATLNRLRAMAEEPRFETDADFLSYLGMSERYYAQLLEMKRRPEESLRAALSAQEALRRSIALGLEGFSNLRHLAKVEMIVVARTAGERTPSESVELLFDALKRSRSATNLDPRDSLHRVSHLEVLPLFGYMAQVVAEHARDLAAANGAAVPDDPRAVAARLLAAIDEEVVFTTSLPIEGAPNPIESKLLEDVAARRDALARLLETMPAGEAPER